MRFRLVRCESLAAGQDRPRLSLTKVPGGLNEDEQLDQPGAGSLYVADVATASAPLATYPGWEREDALNDRAQPRAARPDGQEPEPVRGPECRRLPALAGNSAAVRVDTRAVLFIVAHSRRPLARFG
jgi:hypothetical protein